MPEPFKMDCWLELHPVASHSPDWQLDDLFRMLRCAVRDGVMSVEEVYASINTAFVGRPPAEFLARVKRMEDTAGGAMPFQIVGGAGPEVQGGKE